jgi:hypothetical protein
MCLSLQAPRVFTGAAVSPKVAWLDEADLVHTPAEVALYSCSFSQRMLQVRHDFSSPLLPSLMAPVSPAPALQSTGR